jgi:putative acetyltransferase
MRTSKFAAERAPAVQIRRALYFSIQACSLDGFRGSRRDMRDPITIRKGAKNDAPTVLCIHLAARRAAMPWLAEVHTDEENAWWAEHKLLEKNEVWIADVNSAAAGFAAVAPGWLNHLYVDPVFQGIGVGRRLLDLAKARQPDGLQLWTFARNRRARRFYEAAGFVLVEETDGSGNEEREPDVLYEWRPYGPD